MNARDLLNASMERIVQLNGWIRARTLSGSSLENLTMLTVGDAFPHYSAQACVGTGKDDVKLLTQADYAGRWVVYFFYPKDFTFVCPTEIAEFARLNKEFADRDAVVLGGSTDNEHSKLGWRREHADLHNLPIWSFADAGRHQSCRPAAARHSPAAGGRLV